MYFHKKQYFTFNSSEGFLVALLLFIFFFLINIPYMSPPSLSPPLTLWMSTTCCLFIKTYHFELFWREFSIKCNYIIFHLNGNFLYPFPASSSSFEKWIIWKPGLGYHSCMEFFSLLFTLSCVCLSGICFNVSYVVFGKLGELLTMF